MYKLVLKPQDVLFFRDGKPFGTADSSFAETIFPPHPPSIMGSLRALLIDVLSDYSSFKESGAEKLNEILGKFEKDNGFIRFKPKDGLKIKNIYIKKFNKTYFPAPSDTGEYEGKLKLFNWEKRNALPFKSKSDFEYIMLNTSPFEIEPLKERYFDCELMRKYLLSELEEGVEVEKIGRSSIFYEDEEQIKNTLLRDKKTTREEGGLFMYKVKRIKEGVEIHVEFETDDELMKTFKEKINNKDLNYTTLGGERKVAHYELLEDGFLENCGIDFNDFKDKYNPERVLLKLVLITPSVVKNHVPENMKELFNIKGVSVKGIVSIGGWDSERKLPKDMYKAYLPGTIFLVEPKDGFNSEFYKKVLETNFSDDLNDYYLKPYEGFGAVLIGIEKNIKGGN